MDLISRRAAIEKLKSLLKKAEDEVPDESLLMEVLVPTYIVHEIINSEQQWIPVTERLPKPYEYCLWTTKDGKVIYHHCDGLFSNYTAWMSLPEPYAERREE